MHAWNVTPKEAVAIQNELRHEVRIQPLAKKPRLVAGCDVSMNRFSSDVFSGFVVMTWPGLEVVEESVVRETATFPYIPGFLSFREMPSLLHAWEKLGTKPDLLFVDGIGIAHPRRLGIASHLGVVLGIPAVGLAKSVLTGAYEEPGLDAGDRSYLVDRKDPSEILGVALRTKRNVKPMFVSPGHLIDADGAADLAMAAVRKHRLPEPTRFAHEATNRNRRAAAMK